ncbi:MAG: pyridoxal phosphate-dependent aminotransferase [Polyangia bacterium]
MTFHRNDYLDWYMPRVAADDGAINLHASGMPPLGADEIEPPAGRMERMDRLFEQRLGAWLGIPAAELVFTPGATGGSLLALLHLARKGSRVVVERPIYEPMLRQAERLGAVERLERLAERGWRFSLDEAERLIGGDTSLVMITEPHNPSGILSPREDVLALARIAAKRGARLLVNEIYLGFTGEPSYHGAAENIAVVSSLSKLMGAYWARVGWLAAEPSLVEELRRAHWNMGMPTRPGARAGLGFLERGDELRERARRSTRAGVDAVDEWVRVRPELRWSTPCGVGFGCVELPAGVDDMELAERLHREKGTLTVPGSWFEAPGTLRIAWLQAGDRLAQGLNALGDLLR